MMLVEAVKDVYRPRSPLEAQLEYDRARKEQATQGVDWPEWTAADDPKITERWQAWQRNPDN